MAASYQDWLQTQEISFEENKRLKADENQSTSWLSDVRELYSKRAPGNTCLNALKARRREKTYPLSNIKKPLNDSKGCGGIMRVAPLALAYPVKSIDILDMEGAEIAAITHGHSLGYMPAAVLTHIINRVVFSENRESLKSIILEAKQKTVESIKIWRAQVNFAIACLSSLLFYYSQLSFTLQHSQITKM